METLPTTTSSTPPPTNRRDTQQDCLTPNRPRTPLAGLSNSEPFLRFPRPQGNRHLANWISTSNPDIMRVTTPVEDTAGMTESTFELISGSDIEPHEGNYTESISESVDSLLDYHRPDDVQSLADTEHTFDDESLVDEVEALSRSVAQDESVDNDDDGTGPSQQASGGSEGSESEEEARSRSSLEYTHHSLGTPSLLTPEASKIIERSTENSDTLEIPPTNLRFWMDITTATFSRAWEYATDAASAALPGLLFAVVFSVFVSTLYPSAFEIKQPAETVTITTTATTTTTTTPSVIYTMKSTTPTAPVPQQQITSGKGIGLVPVNEEESDEWLFGPKRASVQFSPLGHGAIMVHVASDTKKAWLGRSCVFITATRAGEVVRMELRVSEDGFIVQFPKKEAHGVVKLVVEATCRPVANKAVKVHFGKGIMEEAYEITRSLAHDLSELVPVAAQEAERCLVGAKKSFGAVSDTVASGMVTVSDSLLGKIKTSSTKMQQFLGTLPSWSTKYAEEMASRVPHTLESLYKQASETVRSHAAFKYDLQDGVFDAQLYLLKTRISAKMWWLKATGQTAKHEEYGKKAKDFIAIKRRQWSNEMQGSYFDSDKDHAFSGRSKRSRCKRNHRKWRDTHFCYTAA